jgi:ABC-type uncharacterized transport system substrate-binding protein
MGVYTGRILMGAKPRTFIAGLSSAAAWPVVARAQQPGGARRIGVLMGGDETDPVWKTRLSAFTLAFADLGWTVGHNARIDTRWGGGDISRIRALAQELVGLGGLVVRSDAFLVAHRTPIILAAARNNVPAVYIASDFVRDGGLLSYGPDDVDIFRRAAIYVDRILRGAKPGDLPVQFPAKYEMVVNLKTAKALGLTVPERLLATADEVIQ